MRVIKQTLWGLQKKIVEVFYLPLQANEYMLALTEHLVYLRNQVFDRIQTEVQRVVLPFVRHLDLNAAHAFVPTKKSIVRKIVFASS
jgi:hypothetical protein